MDEEPNLDWIRDEDEQRNGPPLVIEGHASIAGEPSWSDTNYGPHHLYHEQCGYLWRLHDSRKVGPPEFWPGPFGCPPESVARAAFGDQ